MLACACAGPEQRASSPFFSVRCNGGTTAPGPGPPTTTTIKNMRVLFTLLSLHGTFAGDVCQPSEYCCPDAKHCLTPTTATCREDANVCGAGTTCCPLTKLCVKVGLACNAVCPKDTMGNARYCCPDAKACMTVPRPGVVCSAKNETKSPWYASWAPTPTFGFQLLPLGSNSYLVPLVLTARAVPCLPDAHPKVAGSKRASAAGTTRFAVRSPRCA